MNFESQSFDGFERERFQYRLTDVSEEYFAHSYRVARAPASGPNGASGRHPTLSVATKTNQQTIMSLRRSQGRVPVRWRPELSSDREDRAAVIHWGLGVGL